jgi:hypothetical protein
MVFLRKKNIILWKQGTFTTEKALKYNFYGINGNGCLHNNDKSENHQNVFINARFE